MKKRIVSVLLCGAMVAVLAAGCSNSSSSGTDTAGTDDAADTTTEADNAGSAAEEAADAADAEEETTAAADDGEVYQLKVQSHDPETSATGTFLNNWAAAVNEASGGRLEVTVYHGATLGGPKDTLDMINNGTCDIGWGLQSFFDGVFPVTEVFMLPMIDLENSVQGSTAIWNFYNDTDYMKDEYADYHVLLLHTNCQTPLTTVKKEITSVADMVGLQIRANAGPPTDFITNLGATPASCAINDLYSNLEKGAMDGCLTDWHGISSFKLDETVNYYLDEDIGSSTYYLLMNQGVYDSLPADLQTILDETSADSIQYTSAWDDVEAEIKADESVASKIYNLDEAGRAEFEEVAQQTIQQWIDEMTANGYDGQAIYDAAMQCLEDAKQ